MMALVSAIKSILSPNADLASLYLEFAFFIYGMFDRESAHFMYERFNILPSMQGRS